jgi:hypothetical protein
MKTRKTGRNQRGDGNTVPGEGKIKKIEKRKKIGRKNVKIKPLPHKIRGKQKHLPLKSMSPSSSDCRGLVRREAEV